MSETEVYLEVDKIPYKVFQNSNLKILSLTLNEFDLGNSESLLADNIVNLSKLEILDLTGITISDEIFKNEICKLTKLKELHLLYAGLKKIPEEIGNLVNLNKIVLRSNEIKDLPISFNSLSKLKRVNLIENKIKNIPNFLFELESIIEVNLRDNPFSTVDTNLLDSNMTFHIRNRKSSKRSLLSILSKTNGKPLFSTPIDEASVSIIGNMERMGQPLSIEYKFIIGKHRALKEKK